MKHTAFRRTLVATGIGIAAVLGVATFADAHGGGAGFGMGGGMGGGMMGGYGPQGGFGMGGGMMGGYGPQGGYGPGPQYGPGERGYGRDDRYGPGPMRGYVPRRDIDPRDARNARDLQGGKVDTDREDIDRTR
ncbi:MAG: hypothetical protein EPO20_01030 [Betaproteobacteria bacterium]|nr:MAG: hypothetical protein EPO20_01030 [Betaproteobacteria bacterium]